MDVNQLRSRTIAVPGKLTSAYLALRLCLGVDFACVEVPFDRIIPAVVAGEYDSQAIDAGLIIHEGQLTFANENLKLVVDLGQWWKERTGLPLPLGANAVRKDLGAEAIRDIQRLLKESIEYGLAHREEALRYALQFGRDLDSSPGRPLRRHVCERLDARLRPARPESRWRISGARPRGRCFAESGDSGVRKITTETLQSTEGKAALSCGTTSARNS